VDSKTAESVPPEYLNHCFHTTNNLPKKHTKSTTSFWLTLQKCSKVICYIKEILTNMTHFLEIHEIGAGTQLSKKKSFLSMEYVDPVQMKFN
jgi:hypothetical protein